MQFATKELICEKFILVDRKLESYAKNGLLWIIIDLKNYFKVFVYYDRVKRYFPISVFKTLKEANCFVNSASADEINIKKFLNIICSGFGIY